MSFCPSFEGMSFRKTSPFFLGKILLWCLISCSTLQKSYNSNTKCYLSAAYELGRLAKFEKKKKKLLYYDGYKH